jgi:ParB family chromosome partitioning protein
MQDSGSDMDWETVDTDLNGIDIENSTYRITTDRFIEPLAASIGAVGLLNPPFLILTGERKYTVVSGFRRVAACLHLGYANIRARLLKPDIPQERLAEMAICDNASQRSLNLVETSRALYLLARHTGDPEQFEQACRRLGLPDHPMMRDKTMRVCRMPAAIQAGIMEGMLSLNTSLALDDLGDKVGLMLAAMFRDLHLSHSKQREILTNLDEVARRDKITPEALLADAPFHDLLSDTDTSRAQKANLVRHHFKSKRFPGLTLAEETFQKEAKKLSLGDNLELKAPSGFESREYLFTVKVKNLSDLAASIKTLKKALDNPALDTILTRH